MSSTRTRARRAGALYFVFMIVAIVGEFVIPSFMVPGDPAATARKIIAAESTYRVDILIGFATLIIFIFLVASLYRLFEGVDKGLAMLMVLLVCVGVAVSLANMLHKFEPLVLLTGPPDASVLTSSQRETLALNALRVHASGAAVSQAFWGLWLVPFGMLVIRSGFIPRILGVMLLLAGAAYMIGSVTSIALPEYRSAISRVLMPIYFGEVPIIFWLLFQGVRAARPPAGSPVRVG